MKNQIDELGDLLLESEGIGDDPKHKQHIADLKCYCSLSKTGSSSRCVADGRA
jgi:hypothetical protein